MVIAASKRWTTASTTATIIKCKCVEGDASKCALYSLDNQNMLNHGKDSMAILYSYIVPAKMNVEQVHIFLLIKDQKWSLS